MHDLVQHVSERGTNVLHHARGGVAVSDASAARCAACGRCCPLCVACCLFRGFLHVACRICFILHLACCLSPAQPRRRGARADACGGAARAACDERARHVRRLAAAADWAPYHGRSNGLFCSTAGPVPFGSSSLLVLAQRLPRCCICTGASPAGTRGCWRATPPRTACSGRPVRSRRPNRRSAPL